MIAWIKSLFKKDVALEHRKQEPIVSEPVLTLAQLWKTDKKRFHFNYEYPFLNDLYAGQHPIRQLHLEAYLQVTDTQTREVFYFYIGLNSYALANMYSASVFTKFSKIKHKIYPILGYALYSYPTWMTYDEAKYLCDLVTPYFKERVERYSKLVDYREDRKAEAGKRQTERAKQEERQRLVNLYTKES